jgi:hypothetical protein
VSLPPEVGLDVPSLESIATLLNMPFNCDTWAFVVKTKKINKIEKIFLTIIFNKI